MSGYFKSADYFYVGLSLIISSLGFLSRAYRWKFAINHLGYDSRFSNNLMAVCIAYFVNLTIPRSGEFSRALVLKKYEGIPFDKAFGTIVAERIVDFIIFMMFAAAAFIFQFKIIKEFLVSTLPLEKLIFIAIAGIIFMIIAVLIWFYSKMRIILKLKEKIAGLQEGILSVFQMKQRWPFLFHSIFIWSTYVVMFYVAIFALPETSNIGFGAIITAFVFGSLAIGFTNSGFGAFPLLIAQILLLYSIPETVGTALGWLIWISQTLLTVILGAISLIMLPIINKKQII